MKSKDQSSQQELAQKLSEAEATIEALLTGQIDAVVNTASPTPVLVAKAQDALRISEELYRRIVESSNEGIWLIDALGDTTFMNRRMSQILGRREKPSAQCSFEFIEEPGRAAFTSRLAHPEAGQIEIRFLRSDGTGVWTLLELTPMFDGDNLYDGSLAMVMDITDRKLAELQGVLLAERLALATAVAKVGVWEWDLRDTVSWDATMFEIYGVSPSASLTYALWAAAIDPADRPAREEAQQRAITQKGVASSEFRIIVKDGSYRNIAGIERAVLDERGNVTRMVGVNMDITAQKKAESESNALKDAAEAANRSKSEFLANMSHEIRTPMAAILGFADMLLHRSPEECAQIGCVQIIQRNSMHLLELINDILDLSKVEAGQMNMERVSCDLPELLSSLIALMRPRAAEKGLTFGIRFDGPIPRLMLTDPLRLRQILVNLLGNAVKFTESGKIDLRVTDEGAGGPNIVLRVDVIDTGIGLTPEQIGRLFKPFTQADASVTRKFGGTGLGLTISRQLAHLLAGEVVATSQPGIGSTFTLTVDGGPSAGIEQLQDLTEAALPVPPDQAAQTHVSLRGHILLVEDGADNQRLLAMLLNDAGASVITASNGQIAVDLATSQSFDLILMDMQMPVMDGYAATAELRRRGIAISIIALTAYAMSEDRAKCLASGCTDYLTKPIQQATLLKTVSDYLNLAAAEPDAGARPVITAVLPPPAEPAESIALIDSSRIQSIHINNPRIMQIIPGFVAGLPDQVSKMLDLVHQQDSLGLQHLAHQLLGTCGGYGFDPVSEPARKLEQSLKAGRTIDSIVPETQSLIEVLRRIDGYDPSKERVAA